MVLCVQPLNLIRRAINVSHGALKAMKSEKEMHDRIQLKLKGNGDIWAIPELTHEEKMHIASCDSCSKLWAKNRIEGTKSFWTP